MGQVLSARVGCRVCQLLFLVLTLYIFSTVILVSDHRLLGASSLSLLLFLCYWSPTDPSVYKRFSLSFTFFEIKWSKLTIIKFVKIKNFPNVFLFFNATLLSSASFEITVTNAAWFRLLRVKIHEIRYPKIGYSEINHSA